MEYNKVNDHPHLLKGKGSVINNNKNAYQQRLAQIQQQKELATLKQNQIDMNTKLDLILKMLGDKT